MNKIKKSAQVFFCSLLVVTVIAMLGGCATEHYSGYQNIGSNGPDCSKKNRKAEYMVVVHYEVNRAGKNCPAGVAFLQGDNGCEEPPAKGDKYPPVCLCAGKNETLGWIADQVVSPEDEFAIHFSPFRNGSFESHKGKVAPERIVAANKGPEKDDRVIYEYSITAGDRCDVIDPPVIIRQ